MSLLKLFEANEDSDSFLYQGGKGSFNFGNSDKTNDGFGSTVAGTLTLLKTADKSFDSDGAGNPDWVVVETWTALGGDNFSSALCSGIRYKFNLAGATGTIALPVWVFQQPWK